MEDGIYAGIDVSKACLDLALGTAGELVRVANDARGIGNLRKRLHRLSVVRVILEASSGLETALIAELGAAGLPVIVVNSRQVRDFARATGQLAKTDVIDARVLALFGERLRPAPRRLPTAQERELKAMVYTAPGTSRNDHCRTQLAKPHAKSVAQGDPRAHTLARAALARARSRTRRSTPPFTAVVGTQRAIARSTRRRSDIVRHLTR